MRRRTERRPAGWLCHLLLAAFAACFAGGCSAREERRRQDALREVEAAAETGGESGCERALGGLSDPWPPVRLRAARTLARLRCKAGVPVLCARVETETDPAVRREVRLALEALAPEELAPWLAGVFSALPPLEKQDAIFALGRSDDARLGASIGGCLAPDSDPRVVWAALWAISWSREVPEFAALRDRLVLLASSPNPLAAFYALELLARSSVDAGFEDVLAVARGAAFPALTREAAWRTLGDWLAAGVLDQRRAGAVERSSIEAQESPSFSSEPWLLRVAVVRCLAVGRGEETQARLDRLLEGATVPAAGDADTVHVVAAALAACDAPLSAPELAFAEALGGVDSAAAARARARILARPGGELERVVGAAFHASRPDPLLAALAARGEDGAPPVALTLLERGLDDSALAVRQECLWQLQTASPQPGAALARLLAERKTADWPLRLLALELARSDLPAGERETLIAAALADPVAAVARRAAEILGRGDEAVLGAETANLPYPFVRASDYGRKRNPRALVRLAGGRVFRLELFAEDAPHHVSAFRALARAGAYDGSSVEHVSRAPGVALAPAVAPSWCASTPLRAEPTPGPVLRGDVFSLPAHWPAAETASRRRRLLRIAGAGPSLPGPFWIATRPLPELALVATVWGRVADGIKVVDALGPGEAIEKLVMTHD